MLLFFGFSVLVLAADFSWMEDEDITFLHPPQTPRTRSYSQNNYCNRFNHYSLYNLWLCIIPVMHVVGCSHFLPSFVFTGLLQPVFQFIFYVPVTSPSLNWQNSSLLSIHGNLRVPTCAPPALSPPWHFAHCNHSPALGFQWLSP